MTCTRCHERPGSPRHDHAQRVMCDPCAALPPIVPWANLGPITACPGCGVASSENYGGDGSCWECWAARNPAPKLKQTESPPPRSRPKIPRWQQEPRPPVAGILALLDTAEITWDQLDATLWHAHHCPHCRAPGMYVSDDGGELGLECWGSCGAGAIFGSLEAVAGERTS